MSRRIDALEARRQELLGRCEEQRLELAFRVSQLTPRAALTAWSRRPNSGAGKKPLAWIAGVVGLIVMLRKRRRSAGPRGVGSVGLVTGLVALATRAATILRVVRQLRAIYLSYIATRRPER